MAAIGALLAVFGGILIPVGNHFIEKTIKKEAVIENGTIAYENWIVPGCPIYRQFWVFDVQNPEEVMEKGSAPILEQKGPYTYRMRYMPKENITEHEDGTLSYLQPNIMLFQPNMSVGPESDTVTTVNFAVVAAPALFKSVLIQALMNIWIKSSKSKFLQTRTVKEILWGYEDPFLKKIPVVKLDKLVGIFYPYNKTVDGPYRIYTGKDDINKKGTILTFNNSRTLHYFKSYCDMINGTDASSFHPFVSKSEQLYFFSSDACRSVSARFDREETVKGILLYRFSIPPSAFASSLTNPDNICFCTDKEISKPVYLSMPHFLSGSKILFQFVKGMKPSVEEHTTFLDVEPVTGFTLSFSKRLQINLLVRPNSKIAALKNIKHFFYFPILWLNETATIDDEKADFFRSKVTNKIKLLYFLQWALIIIGSLMFLGILIVFFMCKDKRPK
ncbi:platelet glycoprotein 4-like [Crotalus adamanteus]|uniref:Platelet glycoprotein 4 n=1 Tax=Crotalus adamanteus TaxID=8729 RepID=A0AAW1AQX8_CROAD